MRAKSIKGKSPEEIEKALTESIADGFKPTLAIVFMSFKLDIDAVCETLNQEGIQIFGATSSGEFISREIEEGKYRDYVAGYESCYFQFDVPRCRRQFCI
jgi:hypothetical protein